MRFMKVKPWRGTSTNCGSAWREQLKRRPSSSPNKPKGHAKKIHTPSLIPDPDTLRAHCAPPPDVDDSRHLSQHRFARSPPKPIGTPRIGARPEVERPLVIRPD